MFSGVATLILNSSEISLLDQQIKVTLQRLQKLPDRTPHCVVMFLGGHLPGKALLYMKFFSIFGMIMLAMVELSSGKNETSEISTGIEILGLSKGNLLRRIEKKTR